MHLRSVLSNIRALCIFNTMLYEIYIIYRHIYNIYWWKKGCGSNDIYFIFGCVKSCSSTVVVYYACGLYIGLYDIVYLFEKPWFNRITPRGGWVKWVYLKNIIKGLRIRICEISVIITMTKRIKIIT